MKKTTRNDHDNSYNADEKICMNFVLSNLYFALIYRILALLTLQQIGRKDAYGPLLHNISFFETRTDAQNLKNEQDKVIRFSSPNRDFRKLIRT
jgi:hypothetical protein